MGVGLILPKTASAVDRDMVVIDLMYGGTVSNYEIGRQWQPSLWLDGTYRVAGPLHLGAYFQWLGEKFALRNPGFGGGGLIALRRNVGDVRLTAAFGGGYLGVPVPTSVPGERFRHDGSGTITVFGGLGYSVLRFLGFEIRPRWARYFRTPTGVPRSAWSIEGGITFFIK